MTPDQVRPVKGTIHKVSKKSFAAIVNFEEEESDIISRTLEWIVRFSVAERKGQDLEMRRLFQSENEAIRFHDLLVSAGAVIIESPSQVLRAVPVEIF